MWNISFCSSFSPWYGCQKTLLSKHFITEEFEVSLFVVVDGDEDNPSVGEQTFGDAEAFGHEGEPLAVAVVVVGIDVLVVIDEVAVAGVVGRVDIDDVDAALVGVGEGGEGFEVVALDKDVVGGGGRRAGDVAFRHFVEYGQVGAEAFFHLLGVVLPHKAVFFAVDEFEQGSPLVVAQPRQRFDTLPQGLTIDFRCHSCLRFRRGLIFDRQATQ